MLEDRAHRPTHARSLRVPYGAGLGYSHGSSRQGSQPRQPVLAESDFLMKQRPDIIVVARSRQVACRVTGRRRSRVRAAAAHRSIKAGWATPDGTRGLTLDESAATKSRRERYRLVHDHIVLRRTPDQILADLVPPTTAAFCRQAAPLGYRRIRQEQDRASR